MQRVQPEEQERAPAATADRSRPALLSVVVPCYNEADVVARTHETLSAELGGLAQVDYELIYVDDGSRDATLALLKSVQAGDRRVRVLALSRNFGHQIALHAGISEATGDAVVVMDADLQDPPEVIGEMVAHWRAGADIAYGMRTMREGESAFKLWTAKAFYRLIRTLAEVDIPLDTGNFRLMDRKVVDALLTMPERDRMLSGLVAWAGFRQEPVRFRRAARRAGETKYPLGRMVRYAVDGILSFAQLPLQLATWLGVAAAGVALVGICYAIVARLFTDAWVTGWTALFIAILFLGGVQLVLIGLLGEYLGRIYGEVKRRPLYFLRERLGFEPSKDAQ